MGKYYTPGYVASLHRSWLEPFMAEIEKKKEEEEYTAPLGARNMGILNTILAGANTLKAVHELKQLKTSSMKDGGKVKKYQDGDFIGIPYEEVDVLGARKELKPLDFRKTDTNVMDQLKPIKTPEIKEMSGLQSKATIAKGKLEEGLGVLGEAQTLRHGTKTQKTAAAARLGVKATEQIAKKIGTEGAKAASKKVAGAVLPGIGVATGIEKIAHGDNPYTKSAGVLEAVGGVAKVVPVLGTAVGGILDIAAMGVEGIGMLAGNKPKKQRKIAKLG